MAIYIAGKRRGQATCSFHELEVAFPKMTDLQKETITAVHPALDNLSQEDAAFELNISRSTLNQRLARIYKKFPKLRRSEVV